MKRKVTDFVKKFERETAYSGKTKTMYMPEFMHDKVIGKFGYDLPFKLGIS